MEHLRKRQVTWRLHDRRIFLVLCSFCLLVSSIGCAAPAYRLNPEWRVRSHGLKSPILVPSEVKIYSVSPGGVFELRDDWCEAGSRNLDNALLKAFRERKYRVRLLGSDVESRQEMAQIQSLYRVVNKSIQLHAYGPQLFPRKSACFDYSLGPMKGLLQKLHGDAVIFVQGFDQVSEVTRKTYVSVAVADSSGTILWYCVKGSRGEHDLRNAQSAENLVDAILSDLPEVGV